jgi:hypothetical protein
MSTGYASCFREMIAKMPVTLTMKNIDNYCKNAKKEIKARLNEETKVKNIVVNKGTGAGGANTNVNGKKFEEKANNQQRLLEDGYVKKDGYLSKTFEDKTIYFVLQGELKTFLENKYKVYNIFRKPDEAYIIEYKSGRKVIKILEKKTQNCEGSVETKLWSGPSLKREYEIVLGKEFEVVYGFCVSEFLKNKLISNINKYAILNEILSENNIAVLFGDDKNYFETFDTWFNNSL